MPRCVCFPHQVSDQRGGVIFKKGCGWWRAGLQSRYTIHASSGEALQILNLWKWLYNCVLIRSLMTSLWSLSETKNSSAKGLHPVCSSIVPVQTIIIPLNGIFICLFCSLTFDYYCYHRRWSHRQTWRWKCRVQPLFHQETPRPPQTVRALPELHDPALWGPGGATGPSERQSKGRGRRERGGHRQQWPSQPQECQQRPLWPGGPPCRRLAVRTGLTARADTLIANCLTATHGVEGKWRDAEAKRVDADRDVMLRSGAPCKPRNRLLKREKLTFLSYSPYYWNKLHSRSFTTAVSMIWC